MFNDTNWLLIICRVGTVFYTTNAGFSYFGNLTLGCAGRSYKINFIQPAVAAVLVYLFFVVF